MRIRPVLGGVAALACVALVAACSSDGPTGHSQPKVATVPTTQSSTPVPTSVSAVQAAPAPATSNAVVTPKPKPVPPNHCARNTAAQKVIVSIAKQRMWLCARTRTVETNAITTGMVGQYTETPTGNYVIQGRTRNTVLTLNTGATYPVRYWIPFDGPLFGFHDSSWQTFPYGSAKYRTDGSHGCVHMPLQAIAFLYRWSANATTAVHIA